MPRIRGQRLMKYADQAISSTAGLLFNTIQFFNKYNPGPTFVPRWSDKPLLKSWQKTKPELGWPRQTDSLCPAMREGSTGKDLERRAELANALN